jgi:hypothetical protein
MNKHLIVIGTAVLLLVVGLGGCFEAFSSDIKGLWSEGSNYTWEFKDNDILIIKSDGSTFTEKWDMDSRWIYVIYDG